MVEDQVVAVYEIGAHKRLQAPAGDAGGVVIFETQSLDLRTVEDVVADDEPQDVNVAVCNHRGPRMWHPERSIPQCGGRETIVLLGVLRQLPDPGPRKNEADAFRISGTIG